MPVERKLKKIVDEAKRGALLSALEENDYNIVRTAEQLGVSRPTVYDMIRKFRVCVGRVKRVG